MEGKLENVQGENGVVDLVTGEIGAEGGSKMDGNGQTAQGAEKAGASEGNIGWLTSIPEKFRSGVDTTKYKSMDEWLTDVISGKLDVKENGSESEAGPNEESGSAWEEFYKTAGSDEAKAIGKVLEEGGVKDPSIFSKLSEITNKISDNARKSQLQQMASAFHKGVRTLWGEKADENLKEYNSYLKGLSTTDKAKYDRIVSSGLVFSPEYADVVMQLRKATGEISSPKGTSAGQKKDNGNFGFKTLI